MRKVYLETKIDYGTGEIKETVSTSYHKSNYSFMQVNIEPDAMEHLVSIPASQLKFILLLSPYSEYETNILDLTKNNKLEICKLMNISKSQFYNKISELKKYGWLIKHKNDWVINPQYLWFGETNKRLLILNEIRNERLK